jgi:hypothetical protein
MQSETPATPEACGNDDEAVCLIFNENETE